MLTKAYVEEIVDDYKVRVRIPIFDKLSTSPGGTPTEQLSISPICTIPGGKYNYSVGDIVFVTFEDNDLGRPVILGQLYADIDNKGLASLSLDGLEVLQSAVLPENTTIGNVPPSSIKNLSGIRSPIQQQIDQLSGNVESSLSVNPYMNTIQQAFMEAHYVVLPNGDYIVDSFKVGESPYTEGTHYFYEFANNVTTHLEETPIYEQSRLIYSIDVAGNIWKKVSGSPLYQYSNDTPVYVVFTRDLSSASLYVANIGGTVQTISSSSFFQVSGTEIEIQQGNYSSLQNVHGNKYFWELLIQTYIGNYVVTSSLPNSRLPAPSYSNYRNHYITEKQFDVQIVQNGQNFYSLMVNLQYPMSNNLLSNYGVKYLSINQYGTVDFATSLSSATKFSKNIDEQYQDTFSLSFSIENTVYYILIDKRDGGYSKLSLLNGEDAPTQCSFFVEVSGKLLLIETFLPQMTYRTVSYVFNSSYDMYITVLDDNQKLAQDFYVDQTYSVQEIEEGQTTIKAGDPIFYYRNLGELVIDKIDKNNDSVQKVDVIYTQIQNGISNYVSSQKIESVNVLQMLGTIAFRLSDVDVQAMWNTIMKPTFLYRSYSGSTLNDPQYIGIMDELRNLHEALVGNFGTDRLAEDYNGLFSLSEAPANTDVTIFYGGKGFSLGWKTEHIEIQDEHGTTIQEFDIGPFLG